MIENPSVARYLHCFVENLKWWRDRIIWQFFDRDWPHPRRMDEFNALKSIASEIMLRRRGSVPQYNEVRDLDALAGRWAAIAIEEPRGPGAFRRLQTLHSAIVMTEEFLQSEYA